METLDRLLASWLDAPGLSLWIFAGAAIGSLLLAAVIFLDQRRRTARAARMAHALGRVRKLELAEWLGTAGARKGAAQVEVDYAVEGQPFTCTTWRLYRGNRWVGGEPFTTLAPGREVLVFYDPRAPGFSALVIDQPTYAAAVIAAALAVVFVGMAVVMAP